MNLRKLTVIGAGNVGATLAQRLVEKNFGDVILLDIAESLAKGKALDINQSAPILGFQGRAYGTADYRETADSELIIITSGSPRKPGMSRDELLKTNFNIVSSVVKNVAPLSPEAVLIIVTNPLDAMVYTAYKNSGFPRNRVLGMAGLLDSARFRYFLSEALKIPPADVEAKVFGGHGDEMVPCLDLAMVRGKKVTEILSSENLQAIVARTRQGGAEIVKLLQTGSAFYAPSAAAAQMAAAILNDEKAVFPCAVWLDGEYGFKEQVLGVPAVLGKNGVEKIVEYSLNAEDLAALKKSAESVSNLCRQIDNFF